MLILFAVFLRLVSITGIIWCHCSSRDLQWSLAGASWRQVTHTASLSHGLLGVGTRWEGGWIKKKQLGCFSDIWHEYTVCVSAPWGGPGVCTSHVKRRSDNCLQSHPVGVGLHICWLMRDEARLSAFEGLVPEMYPSVETTLRLHGDT